MLKLNISLLIHDEQQKLNPTVTGEDTTAETLLK